MKRAVWNRKSEPTAAALPKLDRLATLAGLRSSARWWRVDPRHAELRLCLDILERRTWDFRKVARRVASADSGGVAWHEAVVERCLDPVRVVADGGWEAGEEVLRSRREAVDRLFAVSDRASRGRAPCAPGVPR